LQNFDDETHVKLLKKEKWNFMHYYSMSTITDFFLETPGKPPRNPWGSSVERILGTTALDSSTYQVQ
jgi:hypothetical protein